MTPSGAEVAMNIFSANSSAAGPPLNPPPQPPPQSSLRLLPEPASRPKKIAPPRVLC